MVGSRGQKKEFKQENVWERECEIEKERECEREKERETERGGRGGGR